MRKVKDDYKMISKLNFKNTIIAICLIFTLLTVTNIGWNLLTGDYTDAHLHLLMRFLIISIAVGGMLVFKFFSDWPRLGVHASHYILTMGCIFLLVWFSGRFNELHPNAYRDIFLNYSVIYLLITIIYVFAQKYFVRIINPG